MSQLDQLTAQRDRLNTRIQRAQAREKEQERKQETRRKIVVGAILLRWAGEGPEQEEWLRQLLNQQVTAKRDRDLLNLPPRQG